jgi:hypothetical protein
MALAFPLTLAELFDGLAKVETRFSLTDNVENNETQGGEIITASYGPRLWTGSVTVRGNAYTTLDSLLSRVNLIRQSGASFFVGQSVRSGPLADPTGSILGAGTPTITAVNANRRDVTLGGLPSGYVINRGDLLSFTYSSSPTRNALHQVVTGGTASGGGAVTVEVTPNVREGFSTPFNIKLVNPQCKAVYMPGSFNDPPTSRAVQTTFSFSWRQTLR